MAHQGIGEYIWLQINLNVKENFLNLSDEFSCNLREKLLEWDTHLFRVSDDIIIHLKNIYYSVLNNYDRIYCTGQLLSLLSLLISNPKHARQSDSLIKLSMDYILENLDKNLNISEISQLFGMSESGFKHKFRQETGFTPIDYINRQKITYAKKQLLKGHSVIRTAIDIGFNSSSYFTKVFKKYTMMTPTEFIRSSHHVR